MNSNNKNNILQYKVLPGGFDPHVVGQKVFLRFPYQDETIPPLTNWTVPLRIAIKLPEGFSAQFGNIESLLLNHDICCPNLSISSDSTKELQCKLMNNGSEPYTIHQGDTIVQLIVFTNSTLELKGVDEFE